MANCAWLQDSDPDICGQAVAQLVFPDGAQYHPDATGGGKGDGGGDGGGGGKPVNDDEQKHICHMLL